jgi:hypothetical protein
MAKEAAGPGAPGGAWARMTAAAVVTVVSGVHEIDGVVVSVL